VTIPTRWLRALALATGLALLAADAPAQDKEEAPKKEVKKEAKKEAVKRPPRKGVADKPDDYRTTEPNWKARHEKFLARAKEGGVDVLFLGDSITQGWEGAGKEAWKKTFEPLKAANFGIGGDRTEDVLWRITEGKELEGIDPKAVVLMIGTNNTGTNSAEEIASGVTAIVKTLRDKEPQAKVLLLGVFPRAGKRPADATKVAGEELHPKIKEINQRIGKLDDGKHVVYLDIGGEFLDKDGALSKEIMPDFLHLSPKGYAIWAEAVEGKVKELLK
jgi:lysophospholipase L1-like esterase